MYYRINDNIALRGWNGAPFAYYIKNCVDAKTLTAKEFFAMLLCCGKYDLDENDTLHSLLERGLIIPCEKDESPSEWSRYRKYDNPYFPRMNLMITGKCNYNCLHCFNAADNAPLMTEWDFDELCGLLDQARDCGVNAFTITGGEPMLHPKFKGIISGIVGRGMFVKYLNTNGYFITQDILDYMKSIGCNPLMKISFDGVGCHDYMRGRHGAEQRTLAAIRLCVENGFAVNIQTQVNKKTLGSLPETLRLMEDIGVNGVRLIRTSEADRWVMNAGNASLTVEEYYDTMIALAKNYAKEKHTMNLHIWQLVFLYSKNECYSMIPVRYCEGEYCGRAAVCLGNRAMIAVTSDGELVPCMQMSGYFSARGISCGNVHKTPLKELISAGVYHDEVCRTLDELKALNSKCGACRFYEYCAGGCRAMGGLFSEKGVDLNDSDPTKCMFFEHAWYRRLTEALCNWKNLTPLPQELII